LKKENINSAQRIRDIRDMLLELSSKSMISPFSEDLHKEIQRLQCELSTWLSLEEDQFRQKK